MRSVDFHTNFSIVLSDVCERFPERLYFFSVWRNGKASSGGGAGVPPSRPEALAPEEDLIKPEHRVKLHEKQIAKRAGKITSELIDTPES
jgi:hypothetical protein